VNWKFSKGIKIKYCYMWLSLVEEVEGVRAIYGNESPDLQKINLHEIKIVNGEEIGCNLRFDLNKLPKTLPEKWIAKGVNTVQLDISLVTSEILFLKTSGGDIIGDIEISSTENGKKITFRNNEKDVFIILAKWIYLRSIYGYSKE
jgi:Immunity protein 50